MGNEVNFNGYAYPYYNAYQPAIDYAAGTVVEEKTDSVFAGAGSVALFEGVMGTAKTVKSKKTPVETVKKTFGEKLTGIFKKETYTAKGASLKESTTILKDMGKEYATAVKSDITAASQAAKTAGSASTFAKTTMQSGFSAARVQAASKSIPNAEKIAKLVSKAPDAATGSLIRGKYETATKLVERAKNAKTIEEASKNLKAAEHYISNAKSLTAKTAAGKTLGKIASKSPMLAKAGTIFKASGAGSVAIFEGGVEVVTEVIPTFTKLGAKRGFKQLGKSAVKVGASVAGWAAGWYIGAAIGSVIPGAGTAVGAVVGGIISTVCALFTSSIAKKGAEKLVGESELKKAEKEEAQNTQQVAMQQQAIQQQTIQQQQQYAQQQQALQQQLAQQQAIQQQLAQQQTSSQSSTTSFASNPFGNANWMSKDYMGLMSGYVA